MDRPSNPYSRLPARNFWRTAVTDPGIFGVTDLIQPKFNLNTTDRFVTLGSCFAQRLAHALAAHGYTCVDAEPPPPMLKKENLLRFNYGVYAARTGNIYTPAILRQWIRWALDSDPVKLSEELEIWEENERFQDSFRPDIEPQGFATRDELIQARKTTLAAIRSSLTDATVFVFTMGLTETWRNRQTGLYYPSCPGTIAGRYDPGLYELINFEFPDLFDDLFWIIERLKSHNPTLKIILTVSPVPLTASGEESSHALVANSYTKSTLRAVAGSIERRFSDVDYFPSYELVASPHAKGIFYSSNQRTLDPFGVNYVIEHFMRTYGSSNSQQISQIAPNDDDEKDVICNDYILEYYNAN